MSNSKSAKQGAKTLNVEVETQLLQNVHGTSSNTEASNAKINNILAERYSLQGNQKPILMLEPAQPRQDEIDAQNARKQAIRDKKKSERDLHARTLKLKHDRMKSAPNNLKLVNKKSHIRHSRLQHARHGLNEYIKKCKKNQTKLELLVRKSQTKNNSDILPADWWHADKLQFEYEIPTFEQFLPLNALWNDHIADLLFPNYTKDENKEENTLHKDLVLAAKLASADFHGAYVKVTQATNPSNVGMAGIIIWEAKSNFVIVVPRNPSSPRIKEKIGGLRIVEKRGSVFKFTVMKRHLDDDDDNDNNEKDKDNDSTMDFEIVGSRFIYRTSERSTKKFKPKSVLDLI